MIPEPGIPWRRWGWLWAALVFASGTVIAADTDPLAPGRAALSRGQYQEALEALKGVGGPKKDDPRFHYLLGKTHSRLGNDRRAVSSFQRALSIDSDDTRARRALADLYFERKEWEMAAKQYRTLLRHRPESPDVHYRLGVSLFRRNRLREARSHLNKARRLDPSNPRIHYFLGRIQLYHGNNRRGIQHFNRAIRLDPERGQYLFYRGLAYFRRKDYLKSSPENWKSGQNFRGALEAGFGGTRARFMLGNTLLNRGLFYLKEGRSEKGRPLLNRALRQYRRVLVEDWHASNAYHNMSVAYLAMGEYSLALRSVRMALREESDVAFFYDTLGMIQEGLGRTDRAVEAWERVKELAPGYRSHPFSPLLPVDPIQGQLRQARLKQ